MTQPITIRKYSKDNCRPCKLVAAYLRSERDFIAEQAITIEEIDVINDLTEAERGKLPFTSVPILEF